MLQYPQLINASHAVVFDTSSPTASMWNTISRSIDISRQNSEKQRQKREIEKKQYEQIELEARALDDEFVKKQIIDARNEVSRQMEENKGLFNIGDRARAQSQFHKKLKEIEQLTAASKNRQESLNKFYDQISKLKDNNYDVGAMQAAIIQERGKPLRTFTREDGTVVEGGASDPAGEMMKNKHLYYKRGEVMGNIAGDLADNETENTVEFLEDPNDERSRITKTDNFNGIYYYAEDNGKGGYEIKERDKIERKHIVSAFEQYDGLMENLQATVIPERDAEIAAIESRGGELTGEQREWVEAGTQREKAYLYMNNYLMSRKPGRKSSEKRKWAPESENKYFENLWARDQYNKDKNQRSAKNIYDALTSDPVGYLKRFNLPESINRESITSERAENGDILITFEEYVPRRIKAGDMYVEDSDLKDKVKRTIKVRNGDYNAALQITDQFNRKSSGVPLSEAPTETGASPPSQPYQVPSDSPI
jgi:hypothetical protein